MLQQIRDRTSGLIAGFIVALIAIPFAFFGVESFRSDGSDPVVAEVGGQKIYQAQLQRVYEQRYQQLVSLMGENFRADMIDQNRLRASVLEEMMRETMLKQYSDDAGYRADNATLFQAVTADPAFQQDGRFDAEAYRMVLAGAGYTPDRYETQLRDSIEMNQMRDGIVATAFVTDVQLDQALRLDRQQRTLQYALFEVSRYRDRVTVSDEDVAQRYDETKESYQAPERIKLAYVELSPSTMPETTPPDEDVLKVLYDAEKAGRFTTQEERKASHILITTGADKDAARAKIEALAKQLDEGADFAELAVANSEDPGSKNDGGSLGWVRRGQMVEPFEEALYALSEGQISAPVETEFGWHLIRVDEVKAPQTRSFDEPEVRQELTDLYVNRERQQRFEEMSEELEQLAFENPASLDVVSETLGLTVQTTDWLTRDGGSGIAANEQVMAEAFSPEVLQDGENSKPIPLGGDRLIVIRKADYEAPRQRALDEVAEQIRTQLVEDRAEAMANQDATEALNAVREGTDFQEIVSAKGGELRNPGSIARDDQQVEQVVLQQAFKMPRPAADAVSYDEVALPAGGRAVIVLQSVDDSAESAVVTQREERSRRLRDLQAGQAFGEYLDFVKTEVDSEVKGVPAE